MTTTNLPAPRAPADQLITKVTPASVADTVARVSRIIATVSLKLFDVIDHSAAAKAGALELRETNVVSSAAHR